MPARIYLRPLGRVAGSAAADRSQELLRVGGRNGAAFAAVEIVRREADGRIERRMVSVGEARRLAGRHDPGADQISAAIVACETPRAAVAGLSLDRTRIMGIVNVTPDSFSDGGKLSDATAAVDHGLALERAGADILDIGGESTRPGAAPVALDEELRRVLPVIAGLTGRTSARVSVDTRRAMVMRQAAGAGAHLINDVSALGHDTESLGVVATNGLPVVLMHAQGDPRTMQDNPSYADVLLDVYDFLAARIRACLDAGIDHARLIVDPGIGFGKTVDHNLALLAGLSLFHSLGTPILLGASRKSFIGALSGNRDPVHRLPGSIAAALAGAAQGVQIVRVHDVAETRQALTIAEAAAAGHA